MGENNCFLLRFKADFTGCNMPGTVKSMIEDFIDLSGGPIFLILLNGHSIKLPSKDLSLCP